MSSTLSRYTSSDPLTYGISLTEAKRYLRIDHTLDDELVSMLITGSLEAAEDFLGYPITSRSLSADFPTNWTIDIAPFHVKDVAVLEGTSSFTDYELANKDNGASLYLGSLPNTETLNVTFTTGDVSIPTNIKLAMLKYVVDGYEQRSNDIYGVSVAKSSFSFANLLHPNKRYTVQ